MNQPTVELVAETGGAATAPFGWSDAVNSLPVGHRHPALAVGAERDGLDAVFMSSERISNRPAGCGVP
jgi:hypothetical protein